MCLCGIYRRLPRLTVRTRLINGCCPTGTHGESSLASWKPWSAVLLNRTRLWSVVRPRRFLPWSGCSLHCWVRVVGGSSNARARGLASGLKWAGVGETQKLVLKHSRYFCILYCHRIICVLAFLTFPRAYQRSARGLEDIQEDSVIPRS